MPFDGLSEGLVSDLVKLRIALDGVKNGWAQYDFGDRGAAEHCAIGWLLEATDWDTAETTRLALKYLYPALPEKARDGDARLESVWGYNDGGGQARMVRLFDDAVKSAEKTAC